MAKATAEHRIMVCRRVWLLSASPHRYRARTYLWCKGDRSAKCMRVTARSRVSKMGTLFGPDPLVTRPRNILICAPTLC